MTMLINSVTEHKTTSFENDDQQHKPQLKLANDSTLLVRLDERMVNLAKFVEVELNKLETTVKEESADRKVQLREIRDEILEREGKLVSKEEFEPIKKFIYAVFTFMLTVFGTFILSWVTKGH